MSFALRDRDLLEEPIKSRDPSRIQSLFALGKVLDESLVGDDAAALVILISFRGGQCAVRHTATKRLVHGHSPSRHAVKPASEQIRTVFRNTLMDSHVDKLSSFDLY